MTMPLLAVQDLVVRYGQITALDRVSLEVAEGEIMALIGANGAGKSTLIRAIIGQVPLQAGSLRFMNEAMDDRAVWQRVRRGIGVSPEGRRIFPGLTVRENLDVGADCPVEECERRIADVFALFPALRSRDTALGWQLSGGQQQMLAIGRALIADPQLLLLDEPSLGLAPNAVRELYATIRRLATTGRGVLLADQRSAAAFRIADRVCVLQNGRIVAEGTPAELRGHPLVLAAFLGDGVLQP